MAQAEASTSSGPVLRDLLYFDEARAESVYSQISGGLLRRIETQVEAEQASTNTIGANARILAAELQDVTRERTARLEASVLHHALLVHTEELLFHLGVAVDVNAAIGGHTGAGGPDRIRAKIAPFSYLRVEGQAAFEDYRRLKQIAEQFNELLEFIARSSAGSSLEELPAFQRAQNEMQRHALIAQASEGKRKVDAVARFAEAQGEARALVFAMSQSTPIPDWITSGITMWTDLFMPDRLNLRIYPVKAAPAFHVLCNLKRDAFVNDDLETLRLAYGNYPNVDITVFGVVTSLPRPTRDEFIPLPEFTENAPDSDYAAAEESAGSVVSDIGKASLSQDGDGLGDDEEGLDDDEMARLEFERAFRGVFEGAEGLERFARFARHPAVIVQPIAVYRTIRVPDLGGAAPPVGLRARVRHWLRRARGHKAAERS